MIGSREVWKMTQKSKLLGLMLLGIICFTGCVKIPSGYRAVKWTITGGTTKTLLGEGMHMLMPWNKVFAYNIRTQDIKEDLTILANNGLTLELEVSVRFRPKYDELYGLQTKIGPNYYSVILGPSIRSSTRRVGGRYSPEQIYSKNREIMEKEFLEETRKAISGKYIELEAILIRNVRLPLKLQQAISDKLEEEQRALKMRFTLSKEQREAERKKIEAKGIADFQRIVNQGLTPMLLQWKGVEATEKLINSPNSKVIIIGNKGTGGLPLILGTGK